MKEIDTAISPCPNDTFIFRHFAQPGFMPFPVRLVFADVEELNRRAIEQKLHAVTKLSYHAMSVLLDSYDLLSAGGALGRGCGPLLIASNQEAAERFQKSPQTIKRVFIPGQWTTAHLLARLYLRDRGVDVSKIVFEPRRYDLIIRELKTSSENLGLIIHEERFTYQAAGLVSVQDLGEWWEKDTGLPIPLGCIGVRKDVPDQMKEEIEAGIKRSLEKAWAEPESVMDLVRPNAQAMEDSVMRSHIELYVNPYSLDPGEEGRKAIALLFEKAREKTASSF